MADTHSFSLKLRFSGKSIETDGLDLYDGATSFHGFAQAIQIAVHAYMNNEIVSRATALKGAKISFGSPRKGSVLFDLVTQIEAHPATAALVGMAFYDFIKYSLSKAAGYLKAKPETPSVQKIALSMDETFFDQLAETLEGSLQRAHRAIDHGVTQVTIERPRSELVVFNHKTSQWVNTRDENPAVEVFTGSITRYNSISGNGRAFIRELKKVIPFRPGPAFPDMKRGFLSWSLHGSTVATQKELKFFASRIDSAQGEAKRLLLADCEQA